LFKISLENFFKTKFHIYRVLHVQPSELENMDYYEFYYLVKDLTDHLQKENEANKGQQEQSEQMQQNMKIPKMNIPKISVPKL